MYLLPNISYNKNISKQIFLINNINNNNNNNIINKSLHEYIINIIKNININNYNPYHILKSEYYNKNNQYLDMYYQFIEIIKINNIIQNKMNDDSKNFNIFHFNNEYNNKGYQDCINNFILDKINNHTFFFNDKLYFNNHLHNIIDNFKNKNKYNLIIANFFNDINRYTKYNNIMLYQLTIALTAQKYKGCMIFKIYNSYDIFNCEIIYLLSMLYKEVSLFKPTSCCYINGEIFIICKSFKLKNAVYIVDNIADMLNNNKQVIKLLKFNIPYLFIKKIEEYNAIFGQNRIEIINQCLIEKNYNKQEQIKLNYFKKIASFCKTLNIKYLI